MPRRLVSRSELARLAGVSPAAVTKQCRPGGLLAAGCVKDRVDVDAPCVVAWLASKGRKPGPPTAVRPASKKRGKPEPAPRTKPGRRPAKTAKAHAARRPRKARAEPTLLDDLSKYDGLTLRQIFDRHGTERALKDLLEARSKIAAIQERELEMQRMRGELIPRELVKQFVFGAFDAGFRRILTDAIKTLVRRIHAGGQAGEQIEDGERLAGEILSSHIELAKQQAARALQNA